MTLIAFGKYKKNYNKTNSLSHRNLAVEKLRRPFPQMKLVIENKFPLLYTLYELREPVFAPGPTSLKCTVQIFWWPNYLLDPNPKSVIDKS